MTAGFAGKMRARLEVATKCLAARENYFPLAEYLPPKTTDDAGAAVARRQMPSRCKCASSARRQLHTL